MNKFKKTQQIGHLISIHNDKSNTTKQLISKRWKENGEEKIKTADNNQYK